MGRRTVTALLLIVTILPAVYFGGILYFLYMGIFVVTAAWEYIQIFLAMQLKPSLVLTVGGTLLLLIMRTFWPAWAEFAFAGLILVALTFHLLAYERGRDQAALDFVITLGGFTYLGWIGAYIIDLRTLPNGFWWVMTVFPIIWLADSGAYMIGARYGRHKMFQRISPKKSWEGYVAGLFMGTFYGGFFAFAYTKFGPLHLGLWQGVLLGLVLSASSILGDLGESLFKRFANEKDSGNFLPGHGGAFDRIDSLIWAAVLGFFWIRFFLL
jgi:phosphatidate cytidylyltransferase